MSDEWTEADEVIEEIWEIRRQIWARFDNDLEKLMAYYIERDRDYSGPMVTPPQSSKKGKSAA
jgi:hypothetical protein